MNDPKTIIDELTDSQKKILSQILEIEREYQYLTELNKQREKDISNDIIKAIEKEVR